jgi:hypothetical protein
MVRFVVMDTPTNQVLPIEVKENEVYEDNEIFNSTKHTSHLLKCIPRRMDWNVVRKKFIDLNNMDMYLALNEKSLLK